ncbi:MAG: Fur family transcriptional regulator [Steroidobacteraceae bacterium]
MIRLPSDPSPAGELAARLQAHGMRPTAQRLRIAGVLLSAPQHLSAEQLIVRLRTTGARVSKATVYNTLNLFAERGLIRQLAVDGARTLFDSNTEAHYHLHDLDTGALSDVAIPEVEFKRLPPPPPGMEVEGVELVIRVRRRADR